jgi:putative aldouronate transport system permease protein
MKNGLARKADSVLELKGSGSVGKKHAFFRQCLTQRQLILMIVPGFLLILVFNYIPMYGALIAFEKFDPIKGIFGSEWVGLRYFVRFFENPLSVRLFSNTLLLGLTSMIFGFPAPIVLALLMDQLSSLRFKKVVQTISYFPYFISTVVVVGMIKEFFSAEGFINAIRQSIGLNVISFMTDSASFRPIFVGSGIWQGIGWGTIIYLAALSNVDPQLNEAAIIDGANRWQRVRHISWPTILPTTTILLIFSISGILGSDFQKVLLLYSPPIYDKADIISTYVYREGFNGGRFESAAAIGLFMSVLSCILLVLANRFSRKVSDTSLW